MFARFNLLSQCTVDKMAKSKVGVASFAPLRTRKDSSVATLDRKLGPSGVENFLNYVDCQAVVMASYLIAADNIFASSKTNVLISNVTIAKMPLIKYTIIASMNGKWLSLFLVFRTRTGQTTLQ